MPRTQDRIILLRTGAIVGLIGALQAGLAAASAPEGSFHLHFVNLNILFAILIAFGNTRAVSAVRWLAWFGMLPTALLLMASILLQPASLLAAQWHFASTMLLNEYGGQLLSLAIILYMMRQLGSEPVLAARAAAGLKVRDMRIPLVLGCVLGLTIVGFQMRALHGEAAAHAVQLAAADVGPGYQYFANHIKFELGGKGAVQARVQVWNDRELFEIPVEWQRQ